MLLPSTRQHLLITLFKIAALLVSGLALIAVAVLLPAGGHPPGIALVPLVGLAWLAIMGPIVVLCLGLVPLVGRANLSAEANPRYTLAIILVSLYFLHLCVAALVQMLPIPIVRHIPIWIWLHLPPGASLIPIIVAAVSYTLLAGTALRKRWARTASIVVLLIPVLLKFLALYAVGGRTGGLSGLLLVVALPTVVSGILIYQYLSNKKIKAYFSN